MKALKRGIAALLLLACLAAPVYAAEVEPVDPVPTETSEEGITPYAEETKWYYRVYSGRLQRRLWSLTYRCWLTEWIDC